MRLITYRIMRYDGIRHFWQDYQIEYQAGKTVLWGLMFIKEVLDPTLTFSAVCRLAVCGACAMRVNGRAMLVCAAQIDDVLAAGRADMIAIEPIDSSRVIRDLVVSTGE